MRAPSSIARPLVVLAVALASGCRPPLQNGGVEVRPGAAERLAAFCRWRRPDPAGPAFCAAKPPPAAGARVRRVRAGDPAVASARAGDLVLENGEVALVVADPARADGEGGALVDAIDERARVDGLGALVPSLGGARAVIVEGARAVASPGGAAVVEVVGHDRDEPTLAVVTRVELPPGARAARLVTTVENRGAAPTGPIDLGDRVAWAAARPLDGPRRSAAGALVGAIGPGVAYALVAPSIALRDGAIVARAAVAIAPGERAEWARDLVIGARGDELALAAELDALAGGAPGAVEVRFADARGGVVPLPEGAVVRFASLAGEPPKDALPLTLRVTRDSAIAPDRVGGEVPTGRYSVTLEGGGRRSIAPVAVEVVPSEVARVALALEPAAP